jgi:flagellar biogenesis protein FliO
MALVLTVCGGVAAATRHFFPQAAPGALQVVGRACLSPKHTVYLLRVGGRELLVGVGPQAAPALIAELDDVRQIEPNHPREES